MSFPNLVYFMNEVYYLENEKKQEAESDYNVLNERQKCMLELLKKNNYWPTLQFKKFFDHSGMILLYNSQKTNEYVNMSSSDIYKECRSVVIDLLAETAEKSIVSSMYMENPIRISDIEYEKSYDTNDVIESGYEGTMIHVYYYRDQWYFSTTSCPTIDGSKYFHPTKTHGVMFDEYLQSKNNHMYEDSMEDDTVDQIQIEYDSKTLRDSFTSYLDKSKKYLFVLIHHDNKHIVDYSSIYGEGYIRLVHISTYNKDFIIDSLEDKPFESMGIDYPMHYDSLEDGLEWLRSNSTSYALIVKRKDTLLKVCKVDTIFNESMDLGNANPWHNMLWIYLQNRQDFTVSDYAKEKKIEGIKMENGKYLSPTYTIHCALSAIMDYLYKTYCLTTHYNVYSKDLIFKGKIDKTLPPLIRFHMFQLREIQKKYHHDKYLTYKTISHYIRFHQTMKNIRILIQYFAYNDILKISEENQFCIRKLNDMLIHC